MHFSFSVSIQMQFLILWASTVGALLLRVRSGQQQSGFMWIHLTKLWALKDIVPITMRIVRDGLHLGNAPRIQNIWLEVQICQEAVERAAKLVNLLYLILPLKSVQKQQLLFLFQLFVFCFFRWYRPLGRVLTILLNFTSILLLVFFLPVSRTKFVFVAVTQTHVYYINVTLRECRD